MMDFTLRSIFGLALASLLLLSGCKTAQPSVYGDDTGISPKKGDEDLEIRDIFARDLPSYRVNPERSDKYEDFSKLEWEDPRVAAAKASGPISSAYDIQEPLEVKLSQLRQTRKLKIKKIMGYRILVYSGNNATRANEYVDTLEVMMNPKDELLEPSLPRLPITFEYVEPNYVVKIGNYFSRLEAHHQYIELDREAFPQSLVISEPIPLRKAMLNKMGEGIATEEEEGGVMPENKEEDRD